MFHFHIFCSAKDLHIEGKIEGKKDVREEGRKEVWNEGGDEGR